MARAERILAELRAATTEAAGVLKDLERGMKQAREQVDGYYSTRVKTSLDEHTEQWQMWVDQFWSDANADLGRTVGDAVTRANKIIYTAATLEQLCKAVAEEVSAHTIYDEDGPRIDYTIDHRPDPPGPPA